MMVSSGRLIRDDAASQLVATGTMIRYKFMTRQRRIPERCGGAGCDLPRLKGGKERARDGSGSGRFRDVAVSQINILGTLTRFARSEDSETWLG
jgi:hypothetical protein